MAATYLVTTSQDYSFRMIMDPEQASAGIGVELDRVKIGEGACCGACRTGKNRNLTVRADLNLRCASPT